MSQIRTYEVALIEGLPRIIAAEEYAYDTDAGSYVFATDDEQVCEIRGQYVMSITNLTSQASAAEKVIGHFNRLADAQELGTTQPEGATE